MLLQVPCVHESFVHFTPSSQSVAEQQVVAQLAEIPSARYSGFAFSEKISSSVQQIVMDQARPVVFPISQTYFCQFQKDL